MSNTVISDSGAWPPENPEEFFRKNVRLIHALLKPYRGCDEYDDLYQEASLGFYKGIMSFRPSKGVKLTTYAYECARNQVKMHLRRNNAKFRTATIVSLDVDGTDPDGTEHESLLNRDLSEHDSLHPMFDSLEDIICQKDITRRALAIIDNEMTFEQRLVIHRYLQGVPQAETAKELNSSQANVSKILKLAICELVLKMRNRGIIDEAP